MRHSFVSAGRPLQQPVRVNWGWHGGASVSIRNEATGLEMTSVTDEVGTYTIRNVAGGTYTEAQRHPIDREFVNPKADVGGRNFELMEKKPE